MRSVHAHIVEDSNGVGQSALFIAPVREAAKLLNGSVSPKRAGRSPRRFGRRRHPDRLRPGLRRRDHRSRTQPAGATRQRYPSRGDELPGKRGSAESFCLSTLHDLLDAFSLSMCSGAIVLYKIPRVVIGENATFQGGEEFMRASGVELEVVQNEECIGSCATSSTTIRRSGTKTSGANLRQVKARLEIDRGSVKICKRRAILITPDDDPHRVGHAFRARMELGRAIDRVSSLGMKSLLSFDGCALRC
jgi:hypothetical protein